MRSSLRALLLDLSAAVAVRTSVLLLLCVSCVTDARSMWQVRVPVKEPHARRCMPETGPGSIRCCGGTTPCTSVCSWNGDTPHNQTLPNTCINTFVATADEAAAECRSHGRRLCTVQEHTVSRACIKTGCQMDTRWVWTGDACTSPFATADARSRFPAASESRPGGELHADSSPKEGAAPAPCPSVLGEACDLPFVKVERREVKAHQSTPLLAHCITGLARSFATPVVYRSIRANLLLAIPGRAATFVHLKLYLQPGFSRDRSYGATSDSELLQALQHIRPQSTRLIRDEKFKVNPRCTFKTGILGSPLGIQRQIGQFQALHTCLDMLDEHEHAHRLRFHFVVRSRPDMGLFAPLLAPFLGSPAAARTVFSNTGHNDRLFIAPREAAVAVFDLAAHYKNCTGEAWWKGVQEELLSGVIKQSGLTERRVQYPLFFVKQHSCPKWCARGADLGVLVDACAPRLDDRLG